ncbi:MAG: response regulator transcription factor [Bacteroidota bacterium]|nr:response regulator transcription factor [Flavisolibacter sp.]MBD0286099.1 response regulator transcription factor [Flavisolibacter sp.]MBD0365664.1 response regulator transcription factor [Flavisolibacter sp.]MDQ3845672.1 response regulator transcription factor [Bacteroidota bacterium]
MKKITILIADDHTLVRETWSFILNTDERFLVIAECGSGEEAVELAHQLRPDIVIMDINLPGINGIEATHQIRRYSPVSRILGVSLHTQPTYARKMIQKGAMGYVTKNSSRDEMFKAILEIQSGRKYICEEIKNILSDQIINGEEAQTGLNSLSQREIEIINFIKQGYSSKEIGDVLDISVKTVEVHRYNILKKLNLKNAAALVNYINNSQFEFGN